MNGIMQRLKLWARETERDVVALWIGARDSRTPLVAKVVAALVAAYALSPIDLIPDFIPLLGYLDDLILLPLGIVLAVKLIPQDLMSEFRREAVQRMDRPNSLTGAIAIVAVWVAAAALLVWLFWPEPAS